MATVPKASPVRRGDDAEDHPQNLVANTGPAAGRPICLLGLRQEVRNPSIIFRPSRKVPEEAERFGSATERSGVGCIRLFVREPPAPEK